MNSTRWNILTSEVQTAHGHSSAIRAARHTGPCRSQVTVRGKANYPFMPTGGRLAASICVNVDVEFEIINKLREGCMVQVRMSGSNSLFPNLEGMLSVTAFPAGPHGIYAFSTSSDAPTPSRLMFQKDFISATVHVPFGSVPCSPGCP